VGPAERHYVNGQRVCPWERHLDRTEGRGLRHGARGRRQPGRENAGAVLFRIDDRDYRARLEQAEAAGRAALVLLNRAVASQSTVIAFDTAFIAVALLLVVAAPVLIAVRRQSSA
jgi:hypothetical protein